MTWAVSLFLLLALQQAPEGPRGPTSSAVLEGAQVRRIVIQTPEGIDDDEVRAIIQLEEGRPYSMQEVDLDVRRLYHTLPLENVLVYVEPMGVDVAIHFELLPKVIVGGIEISGNRHLSRSELLSVLEMKEGGEFNPDRLDRLAATVETIYERDGFFAAKATVRVVQESSQAVRLHVGIEEGRQAHIEQVVLTGVPPGYEWMEKALGLRLGASYSRQKLTDARSALSKGLIKQGYRRYRMDDPALTFSESSNGVRITMLVEPGPLIEITFSGNQFFTDADLLHSLKLDESRRLPSGAAEDLGRRLREFYQRWGFIFVEIETEVSEESDGKLVRYVFHIQEKKQRFIRSVRFEGNETLSDQQLYEAQQVRTRSWYSALVQREDGTSPLSKRTTNEDLLVQQYRRAGFLSARVVEAPLTAENERLVLTYRVEEGPRTLVDSVRFVGGEYFGGEVLAESLGMEVGQPFDAAELDNGINRIRNRYRQNGFLDVKVQGETSFPESVSQASLLIGVTEGESYRIGQIFLQGNTKTADRVIRRNLQIARGDIINPEKLLETQRRLHSLGLFGGVWVEVLSKDPQAQVANVLVRVQERKGGSFDIGVGIGSAEGVSLAAELAHRNLMGTARSVRLMGEISYRFDQFDLMSEANEYHADIGYREPWLLGSWWSGRLNYITELNRREKTYNYKIDRFIIGADRDFRNNWGFHTESLRLVPQLSWERNVFLQKSALECGFVLECQPNVNLPIGEASRTYHIVGLDTFLVADYRNDLFNPTSGWLSTYRFFYGSPAVGSDFHFLRQDLFAGRYWPLADRTWFSAGARAGYIALLPPSDFLIKPHKYVLGGVNTVRGYGLDRIFVPVGREDIPGGEDGGLASFSYQLELRFPLVQNLGGVLFHDAGQVWPDVTRVSLPLLYTAGGGLRYDTPVGPIRLDVGWKLNREDAPGEEVSLYEIHFAIGSSF